MLELEIFSAGLILLTLGIIRKERPRKTDLKLVREILESGSVIRGISRSEREERVELFRGKFPEIKDDPLIEYIQEASKVGRVALNSGPEVNRYLSEIEELLIKMEGIDRVLRFRGRVLSFILAILLPVAVRIVPVVVSHSSGSIGPIGEVWMAVMVLLSSYFITSDAKGRPDLAFLGLPLVALAVSNYMMSKTLEPLFLRVLINPLRFNWG